LTVLTFFIKPFSCRLVLEGHPLIAIHKGRYYRRGDGIALGPGPFVTALEYACDAKSEVVGKPEPAFFQQVLDNMDADARTTVMIGDVSKKIHEPKGEGSQGLCNTLQLALLMCFIPWSSYNTTVQPKNHEVMYHITICSFT